MTEELNDLTTLPDENLIRLCCQRPVNQEAWYTFYNRFYEFVRGQVRRKLKETPTEIDDLVQEAFTKIFRILPTYDSSKAQLKTYIAKVTTNLVIDYMRHGSELRLHTVSLSTDLSVLKVYAEQDSEVLRLAAEQIVDGLRDKSKVPMIRDLLRGREVKEICADYRVTEYQVYTTRNWLRDLLREVSASVGSS